MGIRETINRRPSVVAGIVTGVIICAGVAMFLSTRGPAATPPSKAAYTSDGGKTWLADVDDRVIPYEANGQTFVGAVLFSGDGGKTKFVGYLSRYAAVIDAKKRPWPQRLSQLPGPEQTEIRYTIQVKPPLSPDSAWVTASSPPGAAIMQIKTADGRPAYEVEP